MNILNILDTLKSEFPDWFWSKPPDLNFGILSTNIAFKEAKNPENKESNPTLLAKTLATKVEKFVQIKNLPLSVKTVGPYINLDLNETGWEDVFKNFPELKLRPVKGVALTEFFNPNVAKKMHVGHLRSANIGESIRRVLLLKYDQVISDRHLGDWGVQFGMVLWGYDNIDKLSLSYSKIDFENDPATDVVKKLNEIYVAVNKLIETNPEIREKAQTYSRNLETEFQELQLGHKSLEECRYLIIWKRFVEFTNQDIWHIQDYLNMNKDGFWSNDRALVSDLNLLENKLGIWEKHQKHVSGKFDFDLGESFYNYFLSELDTWIEAGIVKAEKEKGDIEKIYIDLEEEGLGRCHLISSDGYSTYILRDVFTRFVWYGYLGVGAGYTFVDSRQAHSLNQSFAVIHRILDAGIYQKRSFPGLSQEQTDSALSRLETNMPKFIGFGYLVLPEGPMSTRKGNVFRFEAMTEILETEVEKVLEAKAIGDIDSIKVKKIAVASLKWADLSKDREQDIEFDINQVLKFEGNTGVYQLYTLARINGILEKHTVYSEINIDYKKLNNIEIEILRKMLLLPWVLEDMAESIKPHLLCTFLFDFSTMLNSWYAKYSVTSEADEIRKNSLLALCILSSKTLKMGLELLGIETLEKL